jgi:hypothetical protein
MISIMSIMYISSQFRTCDSIHAELMQLSGYNLHAVMGTSREECVQFHSTKVYTLQIFTKCMRPDISSYGTKGTEDRSVPK